MRSLRRRYTCHYVTSHTHRHECTRKLGYDTIKPKKSTHFRWLPSSDGTDWRDGMLRPRGAEVEPANRELPKQPVTTIFTICSYFYVVRQQQLFPKAARTSSNIHKRAYFGLPREAHRVNPVSLAPVRLHRLFHVMRLPAEVVRF